ncbi:nicotinamide riboside transporter PnuC [Planctobacterium marinum]|uniref:nicotinamide riboside transporter PnuC n=1 Tax=Planctobacterium marinum TaxID=1631968 RepID=UPI001E5C81C6|nr:nicotinamide riboside transporter PnuC [Planctobacterium marinum]MCC2604773.1 nicotinamide riboside transporter PnuC [Planctobacterium marinum]
MLIEIATHPVTELLAICCFLTYVLLSAKGLIWCWAAGFLTSFLYTFIFIGAHLPGQVVLNILFMLMSVWGWSNWLEDKKPDGISVFTYADRRKLLISGVIVVLFAWAISLLLPSYFESGKPTIEAIVIAFSLYATVLTIYRKIDSWLYWALINFTSFLLFYDENLWQTSFMYLGVAIISVWGFYNWRSFRRQDEMTVTN